MSLAYKISKWNRGRKWKVFRSLFSFDKNTKILDAGFSDEEYGETDNYLEKHYPYLEKVTALGVDTPKKFSQHYPKVKAIKYHGGKFPFADNSFDICWSNAVLEHVGDREKQLLFLREIKRVSKQAFITTPNRLFPIEVHTRVPFLHLILSKKLFDVFLKLIGREWATGDYMHLLSVREIKSMLAEADINNYRIIKNKLFGFTLDVVIKL